MKGYIAPKKQPKPAPRATAKAVRSPGIPWEPEVIDRIVDAIREHGTSATAFDMLRRVLLEECKRIDCEPDPNYDETDLTSFLAFVPDGYPRDCVRAYVSLRLIEMRAEEANADDLHAALSRLALLRAPELIATHRQRASADARKQNTDAAVRNAIEILINARAAHPHRVSDISRQLKKDGSPRSPKAISESLARLGIKSDSK